MPASKLNDTMSFVTNCSAVTLHGQIPVFDMLSHTVLNLITFPVQEFVHSKVYQRKLVL